MKRKSVVVDETLLEDARRALGETTNSGAITKALQNVVRNAKFWEAYRKWQEVARTEGMFHPDYIKEKTAKSKRLSAHQVRTSSSERKRRGTR